jgi:hypothetical protein
MSHPVSVLSPPVKRIGVVLVVYGVVRLVLLAQAVAANPATGNPSVFFDLRAGLVLPVIEYALIRSRR